MVHPYRSHEAFKMQRVAGVTAMISLVFFALLGGVVIATIVLGTTTSYVDTMKYWTFSFVGDAIVFFYIILAFTLALNYYLGLRNGPKTYEVGHAWGLLIGWAVVQFVQAAAQITAFAFRVYNYANTRDKDESTDDAFTTITTLLIVTAISALGGLLLWIVVMIVVFKLYPEMRQYDLLKTSDSKMSSDLDTTSSSSRATKNESVYSASVRNRSKRE